MLFQIWYYSIFAWDGLNVKYNSERHHRRSLRLKGYDYTQNGAYYVTICTQKRQCLLGTNKKGEMVLNEAGHKVKKLWDELPEKHPIIEIDQYIIMPNHVHGIICIVGRLLWAPFL